MAGSTLLRIQQHTSYKVLSSMSRGRQPWRLVSGVPPPDGIDIAYHLRPGPLQTNLTGLAASFNRGGLLLIQP
uniref:Uncharacterized protein n=1 Tax=Arundo donax TaxID=35708 RepID=A0A0A9B6B1_ARUDO